ncbi:MAG TPA: DUF503 domain-containing protein [Myxococcota bacterium]|nr:DUF503 domain-containing protein [Myxococcota bacterium]
MIVGACVVELHIEGAQSLKAKRGVIRSIVRRVRNEFNLAVSEIGGQDTWQYAALGLAAAGMDAATVRSVLERAGEFIEDLHLARVLSADIEVVDLPHDERPWNPEDDGGDEDGD